jgi:hypothetical protein
VAGSLNKIGEVQVRIGRFSEADTSFTRSRAIHEDLVRVDPASIDNRNGLAGALTGLGRARYRAGEAARAVDPLRRAVALREAIPNLSRDALLDLVRGQALMAALAVDSRSGLSRADGLAHAERAMTGLREAIGKADRKLDILRTDTDLDSLRSRLDFRILMMDLAMPADPFAR